MKLRWGAVQLAPFFTCLLLPTEAWLRGSDYAAVAAYADTSSESAAATSGDQVIGAAAEASDRSASSGRGLPGLMGLGSGFLGLLYMGYRVMFNARRATNGVAGLARIIVRGASSDLSAPEDEDGGWDRNLSFDQRVAARLAELESGQPEGPPASGASDPASDFSEPAGPSPGVVPAVRGFGRKRY